MANDINRLIDMIYERIEDAKAPALKPSMSIVDRDELLDLLDELRAQLPAEIKRAQELLSAREKFVEDAKRDVERMMRQAELEAKKRDLDSQRDAANALVTKLRQQQQEQENALDDLSEEEEQVQARIKALIKKMEEEEAARRAAAGQSGPTSNPGGYIWPVNSRYITSTVGGRASPGGIGSTNHKGTDIGRVGYNSSIYAAKAGQVIISEYSSSYGHYVVVYHGPGNSTLYGHMSSRKVSVGQQVKQGDVLGITGSTGRSTGPHLHFEIKENDTIINPLNDGAATKKGYLTGYTLSD